MCSQMNFNVSDEPDTFLLGPDAKIHFTDTHLTIPDGGLEQFCVEQMDDSDSEEYVYDDNNDEDEDDYNYDDEDNPEDPVNPETENLENPENPEYLYSHGENYHDDHTASSSQPGGCSPANNKEDYADSADWKDPYNCHDEANDGRLKPHEMVAFMCYRQTC